MPRTTTPSTSSTTHMPTPPGERPRCHIRRGRRWRAIENRDRRGARHDRYRLERKNCPGHRGIARHRPAIAERLAGDGAVVAVHYGTREAEARDAVESIEAAGGNAFPIRTEFGFNGVGAEVETLFRELDAMLDDKPLDILVTSNHRVGPHRRSR